METLLSLNDYIRILEPAVRLKVVHHGMQLRNISIEIPFSGKSTLNETTLAYFNFPSILLGYLKYLITLYRYNKDLPPPTPPTPVSGSSARQLYNSRVVELQCCITGNQRVIQL